MQLGELKEVSELLACHPLGGDRLWQKECETVTDLDICLFYGRSGISNKYAAAKLVQSVQDALTSAAHLSQSLPLSRALMEHEPPKEPFYVDEFVEGLNKLSSQACLAAIFSLETRLEPTQVGRLTWKEAGAIPNLNQIAVEILEKAKPRKHARLPYVFWEKLSPSLVVPIFDLSKKIERAFGMDWAKLLYSYTDMMPVCRESEAEYFKSHFRQS